MESKINVDGTAVSEYVSSKPVSADNKYMHTISVNRFRSENIENMGSVATYSFVLNLKEVLTSAFPKEFRVTGTVKTSVGLVFSSEDLMTLVEHQPEITTVHAVLSEPAITEAVATNSLFIVDFDSALLWRDSDKSKFLFLTEDMAIVPFEPEISEDKKQVTLKPSSPLNYATSYEIQVLEGLTAEAMNTIVASECFHIKTADSETGISEIVPADGNLFNNKYVLKPEFIINFSKPVMSYEMLKDSLVVRNSSGFVNYRLVLSEDKKRAELSFDDYLANGETYSVLLANAITDTENIAIKPFEKLDFETCQLLNIKSSTPAPDAVDVATDTIVSVTFDERISCSGELKSIFVLKDSNNGIVSAEAKISDDHKSIILTPEKPLLHNMKYTVNLIGEGIISEDSKQPLMMAGFSFTTGDSDLKYQAVLNIADSNIGFDYKNNKKYYTDTEFEIDFNTAVSNKEAVANQIKFYSNQQEFSPSSVEWSDNKVHFTFPVEKHFGSNYTVAIDGRVRDERNVEILPFKAFPMSLMDFAGRGTESSPFQIENTRQLDMVRFYLNKHFKQVADVDFTGYVSEFYPNYETEGFTPIGNAVEPFTGSYDGGNKSISGLFINKTWMGQIGLFGYISNAKISNVKTVGTAGCQITSNDTAGAIAGYAEASIIASCSNSITVTGSTCQGGIVGQAESTTIKNCINDADVCGTEQIAGIVSNISADSSIDSCINNGNISAVNTFASGIVAFCYNNSVIQTCINNGNISSEGTFVGGIVGMGNNGVTIKDSDNFGQITGATEIGGIVGQCMDSIHIEQCDNNGGVSGTSSIGGIVGIITGSYESEVKSCTNTGAVSGSNSIGGISGFLGSEVEVNSNINNGDVTGDDNIGGIVGQIGGAGVTIVTCENHGKITASNDYAGGIYGFVNHQTVNVSAACSNDNTVVANNYCGGIAGNVGAGSIVSKCVNKGNVSVINDYCGGCFGKITEASRITECSSIGDVTGINNIGGFVGYIGESSIVGSITVAFESITGNDYIGGFAGQFMSGASVLNDSVDFESIAGNDFVGGFGGEALYNGRIWDSKAVCENVTGNQYVAGFLGKTGASIIIQRCYAESDIIKADADYAGGLTGSCDPGASYECCYAVCNEISATNYVGGLVGFVDYSSPFVNSYAICGEIAATSYVGGLVGCINGMCVVETCYAVSNVVGNSNVGALVGYNNGNVSNCFTTVGSQMGGVNVSDVSQFFGPNGYGYKEKNYLLTNGFASEIRESAWSYMDWFNETIWKLNDDSLPTLVKTN